MERGNPDSTILEGPDVVRATEAAIVRELDRVRNSLVDDLLDRGEDDALEAGSGDVLVSVDANRVDLLALAQSLLRGGESTDTGATRDREDDIGAFLEERLGLVVPEVGIAPGVVSGSEDARSGGPTNTRRPSSRFSSQEGSALASSYMAAVACAAESQVRSSSRRDAKATRTESRSAAGSSPSSGAGRSSAACAASVANPCRKSARRSSRPSTL